RKYAIDATRSGHVSVYQWSAVLAPGETADFGDLPMPPGYLLSGVVRDRTGAPVGGLSLGLAPPGGTSSWMSAATTADDGSFAIRSPMPAGRYEVQCSEPIAPRVVELGE